MERPGAPGPMHSPTALCDQAATYSVPNGAAAQVKASWTAVYGIIAKTMIGDNYPEA